MDEAVVVVGNFLPEFIPLTPFFSLQPHEYFWVEHQSFLLSRGYQLRPRYHASWTPSWTTPKHNPGSTLASAYRHEDIYAAIDSGVIDATRVADGKQVVLRITQRNTQALEIIRRMNWPELRDDWRNKVVPLLDHFALPDNPEFVVVVEPILRRFDSPLFRTLEEVAEALFQFLGLEFLHKHDIAHRDVTLRNMKLDASDIIPDGFHFSAPHMSAGEGRTYFQWRARHRVLSGDYFLVDFGLAKVYPEGPELARDVGVFGCDPTVPELSDTVPYNPFKVDVFQLGNTFVQLSEKYPLVERVFQPLLAAMTSRNPEDRPTPTQAITQLVAIGRKLSSATSDAELLYVAEDEYDPGLAELENELISDSDSSEEEHDQEDGWEDTLEE
ncbi:Protein kinase domain-containing protein [Mycena kentingensis (nom. inval.)]|nr:Protein kinase domain-containing protein [Mycena kentingensis (nom. inval.)]